MKKFIIILLIIAGINSVYATHNVSSLHEVFETFNSSFTNLEPSYRIVPILDKEVINPGESFSISFQIAGAGKVEANKLVVFFSQGFLSTEKESCARLFVASGHHENGTYTVWYKNPGNISLSEGQIISLVSVVFMEAYPNDRTIWGEKATYWEENGTQTGWSKNARYGGRPIVFEVFSSENAPRGDNTIRVTFVYSDGKKWYTSQEDVTIHVREWYELQWFEQPFTALILVLLGILIFGVITEIGIRIAKLLWSKIIKPIGNLVIIKPYSWLIKIKNKIGK